MSTQWERHIASIKIIKDPTQVVHFSNPELRQKFGFNTSTIRKFRQYEKRKRHDEIRLEKGLLPFKQAISERNKRIVELRLDKGYTLEQIAKEFSISRERVRQVLLYIERIAGVTFPKSANPKPKPLMVAVHCKVCGKILEIPENKKRDDGLYFCKPHKLTKVAYGYWLRCPQWFEMSKNQRSNWRWHNDKRVRDVQMAAVMRRYHRVKNNPEHKANQKIYTDRYMAKKKAEREAKKPKTRDYLE